MKKNATKRKECDGVGCRARIAQWVNLQRYKIDFRDAIPFFAGIIEDKVAMRLVLGEMRYLAIGVIQKTIVAVVYAHRQNRRRIISIRKARDYERGSYIARLARLAN